MRKIDRESLRMKMSEANQPKLVEVLPEESFNDFHLPGAVNAPVHSGDFEERIRALADKDDEVVVYCKDSACDASLLAAEKIEKLGFRKVFDYEAGKVDWRAAGFPVE